ncbi:homoserine O-acetyltransferase [Planococcus antarcticus DSM 14505]|uniref:Homoserine O-acetyltransferase n=1 Tax=Planococcus antarcticus DSM 14505 TaxID=1185653 RepID=A0ABM6D408_9BACL|nr:homoserine O-acetyltransferase [Planococcus antarcticus]ANU09934.1 homoserine O-acetyltransferase [Planococcus antarcticus DSM 14505]
MKTVSIGSLTLDSTEILNDVELAYERLGDKKAPAILVCHALTGDQYAIGTEENPGWWAGLIGPGKPVDTTVFQVITFNVLGGCHGSTGPLSKNPETGEPYRAEFPTLTIRDMVRAEYHALKKLGIDHLAGVIGGSLGGMKTLEWGKSYPEFIDAVLPLAVTPYYGDYGVAFNHIGILAIENDRDFNSGNYEDSALLKGFQVARMAGMLTYRSGNMFNQRFGRTSDGDEFNVQSYLNYQGKKLAGRFDANSYVLLLKAMNTHDIQDAVLDIPVYSLSFTHDLLYPSELMVPWLEKQTTATWEIVETNFGHDGFLVEFEKWGGFIEEKLKSLFVPELTR